MAKDSRARLAPHAVRPQSVVITDDSSTLLKHGLAYFQRGNVNAAAELFQEALTLSPDSAELHHNLASALAYQGQIAEAAEHFAKALKLAPTSAETCRNLASALVHLKRWGEAEAYFQRAIELTPASATAWSEYGHLLRKRKQYPEAIKHLRQAVKLRPDDADLLRELGIALSDAKQDNEAEKVFKRALAIRPDFTAVHWRLGQLYDRQKKPEAAVTAFEYVVRRKPKSAKALNSYGAALASNQQYAESIEYYERALALQPRSEGILNNLGNALRAIGQFDRAIECFQESLAIKPHYSEAYNNLGIALSSKGYIDEAIALYERAIHLSPNYGAPQLNRSMAYLSIGDFERGWNGYEWRGSGPLTTKRKYKEPRWYGGDVCGKTVYLYAEQGLGDTLQFIRYAALVKQRGARVIAEVQRPLLPLMRSFEGVDQFIAPNERPLPKFDTHAVLMSLPSVFRTTIDTIPTRVPYLHADQELVAQWKERLAAFEGFKIAISWQGNPKYKSDHHRSIALRHFEAIAQVPGVRLISLQKGFGTEQIAQLADRVPVVELGPFDEEAGAFMDSAAIMSSVDLVICSDSSLAHLAGALGVPVWLAVPFAPDWRWLRDREDSPWYPTMRLFRQQSHGDWESVFQRIGCEVAEKVHTNSRPASTPPTTSVRDQLKQGAALAAKGQLAEAFACFKQAALHDPRSASAHQNLGVMWAMQGKHVEAERHLLRAIELAPDQGDAYANLGVLYLDQGRYADAIDRLQAALRCNANAATTYNGLGTAYLELGKPREAVAAYRKAIVCKPDYAEAHVNLSRALLCLGEFAEGWLEYEWRWKCPGVKPRTSRQPRWAGDDLCGRTILLHTEQFAEDTLQFVRYARLVKQRGGRVVVETPQSFARLLRTCPGVDEVAVVGQELPAFDVQIPLLSVPWLFRTTPTNVSTSVPYFAVDSADINRLKNRLPQTTGLRIGIVWPEQIVNNKPLCFDSLRELSNDGRNQLVRLPMDLKSSKAGVDTTAFEWLTELRSDDGSNFTFTDYADMAVALKCCDLIVGPDSPACHIAGALGMPVWVALTKSANWRWLQQRTDSPWYPTMRLVRQLGHEENNSFITRLIREVQNHVERCNG